MADSPTAVAAILVNHEFSPLNVFKVTIEIRIVQQLTAVVVILENCRFSLLNVFFQITIEN